MLRRILGWSGIPFAVVLAYGYVGASSQDPSSTTPQPTLQHRALLDQYCVGCHNDRLQTAGLALDTIDVDHVTERPGVWEKVLLKLATRQMPPSPMPRPDDPVRRAANSPVRPSSRSVHVRCFGR